MNVIKQIIEDNEGNHIVVALTFYDNDYKLEQLRIPEEFHDAEIADIGIEKLDSDRFVHPSTLFKMSSWLLDMFRQHRNTVFSFICSTDDLKRNHTELESQVFRWALFERLLERIEKRAGDDMLTVDFTTADGLVIGRVFYRWPQSPIVNIVVDHLRSKNLGIPLDISQNECD
ncbi:MAG: hypothetical protein JFR41_08045 [Muribaculaceae bacterium]|nr:hypothetical protein [Muribaculaceae bacterium]